MGDVNLRRGRLEAAVEAYESSLARIASPASGAVIKAKIGRVYGHSAARGVAVSAGGAAEPDPTTS